MCLSGIEMGVNAVCTVKIDGKHDLLTFFYLKDKNKTQLSLSGRAREVADDVSWPILVTLLKMVTSQTCDQPSNVVVIVCLSILLIKN